MVVRVAVKLAVLSVLLATVSLVLSSPGLVRNIRAAIRTMTVPPHRLTVDDVLAWRNTYGDLLGKPREALIERFGTPKDDDENSSDWNQSPKTRDREVAVVYNSVDTVVKAVKVFARRSESLDAVAVLRKAPVLKFETGTYKDSLQNYFIAETQDGRNLFQFDVAETGVKFRDMMFTKGPQK